MSNEKVVIPEVNVKSIHMDERGCDIQIQSESVLLLAEHFGKLLGDAPNFITMSVMHPEIGMIDMTLQKVLGKPQAQVLREMREQVAALTAEVDALKAEVAGLRDWEECAKQLDRAKLPCGHNARYANTEDGGKHGFCTLCEVARLSAPVSHEEWNGIWYTSARDFADKLILARATPPQDVEKS